MIIPLIAETNDWRAACFHQFVLRRTEISYWSKRLYFCQFWGQNNSTKFFVIFHETEIYCGKKWWQKLVKTCVEPIHWNSKTIELLASVPIAFQLHIKDSSLTVLLHLFEQKITYPYRVWWLTSGSHFTLKHPACCVEPIPWNSKTIELLTSVPIAFQTKKLLTWHRFPSHFSCASGIHLLLLCSTFSGKR